MAKIPPSKNIKEFIPSTDEKLNTVFPAVSLLKQMAQLTYGVDLAFFQYQNNFPDTEPKSGVYAIVVPDVRTLAVLMDGTVALRDVLLDNVEKHPNEVPCYYNSTYLGDINRKNAYEKVRQIEQAIQDISTAKYAFQEYGFDLPRTLQQITIDKFDRYNNIRHAQDLRPEVRAQYEQVMKDSVIYANSIYNKDIYLEEHLMRPAPKWQDNIVERDYFEKNHIIQVNDVVSEDFWEYLKERLPESPGFHIWKDKKPSLVLEDNSSSKGIKGINIWSKQKGYKEYNVAFADGQQGIFYSWLLDYQHRDLRCVMDDINMLKSTKQLQPVSMPRDDLELFDAYCQTNHISYTLNHGLFGHNCPETIRTPIIGVRVEDRPKVDAILERMVTDKQTDRGYTKDRIKELDMKKKKCVNNPYLKLLHLQSRTDVWQSQLSTR